MTKAISFILIFVGFSFPFEVNFGASYSRHDVDIFLYDGATVQGEYKPFVSIGIGTSPFDIGGLFSIGANLYWIRKGANAPHEFHDSAGKFLTNFQIDNFCDYVSLTIPIYRQILSSISDVYLSIGPRIDFALNRSEGVFGYSPSSIERHLFQNEFNEYDWGLDLGLEYRQNTWSLEYRYSPNFSHSYSSEVLDIRSTTHQVVFGVVTSRR